MKLFISINRQPITIEIIMTGIAILISFKTPDKDVYVEEPVKFRAK